MPLCVELASTGVGWMDNLPYLTEKQNRQTYWEYKWVLVNFPASGGAVQARARERERACRPTDSAAETRTLRSTPMLTSSFANALFRCQRKTSLPTSPIEIIKVPEPQTRPALKITSRDYYTIWVMQDLE